MVVKKFLICCAAALVLVNMLGGKISGAEVIPQTSEIYSEQDIDAAISAVRVYFKLSFFDCTLTEIGYIGDEHKEQFAELAEHYGADEVIILTSSFDVGKLGGDGSLNPNSTYSGWTWELKRELGGKWRLVDYDFA